MASPKTIAAIVTFNPDPQRLKDNLETLPPQVDELLIIDNGSNNLAEIRALINELECPHLIANGINRGISGALNQAMEWSEGRGAGWVLLLDQDSVLAPGSVAILRKALKPGVAVASPAIVDRNNSATHSPEGGQQQVDYCITSGSLCDISTWRTVGGYDETLFIDFVDFDYCIRLRMLGYTLVRDGDAVLLHEIGRITKHGRLTAYNHSAFRLRHMANDMLAYAHKHRKSPAHLKVHQRGIFGTYAVLAAKALIIFLFEDSKVHKFKALAAGSAVGTLNLIRRSIGS